MSKIFLEVINMSITASWLVFAVILLRFILKKAPKWIMGILWGFVGLRLVLPFSVESVLSLIPSKQTIPDEIITGHNFHIESGIAFVDNTVNGYLGDRYFEGVTVPVNNGKNIMELLSVLWLVGIFIMLLYTAISYIRIKLSVKEAVVLKDNIWSCDKIPTPFILGVISPKIFLPYNMGEGDAEYVIAHERAHIKRLDHFWKPLGFLMLTVYWFNPILWVAYILLCRDIELATDEKVIKNMGAENKRPYSEALINCSVPRKTVTACPLAFGEVGVRSRIKGVLNYNKPAFWIIILSVAAVFITAVCLLTNPKTKEPPQNTVDPYSTPQNPDGAGLNVSLNFLDEKRFEVVFNHTSEYDTYSGTITTPPDFEVMPLSDPTLNFEEYMRSKGFDYAQPQLTWDTVLYTIKPDDVTRIEGNLSVYGVTFPEGEYVLMKPITITGKNGQKVENTYALKFSVDKNGNFNTEYTYDYSQYKRVASLKTNNADTSLLIKFGGALYGRSFALIDYAGGTEPIGIIDKLIDPEYVPKYHGETNNIKLLGASVYESDDKGIILLYDNTYRLFSKISQDEIAVWDPLNSTASSTGSYSFTESKITEQEAVKIALKEAQKRENEVHAIPVPDNAVDNYSIVRREWKSVACYQVKFDGLKCVHGYDANVSIFVNANTGEFVDMGKSK